MANQQVAPARTHGAAVRAHCRGLLLAAMCAAAMGCAHAGSWDRELQACGGLDNEAPTYRLASRPGLRGDLALNQGFRIDGVDYRAAMTARPMGGGSDAPAGMDIRQLYLEGKGYGLAPDTALWAGRRLLLRTDTRVVERFVTDLSGVGAGLDAPLGSARLGLSYFGTDGNAIDAGSRLNLDVHEIGTLPGGRLRLVGTLTQGSVPHGTRGLGLIAMHTQDRLLGRASHTLWLAYAQGSAGLDGNFGGLGDPASVRSWRVVQSLGVQAGVFGGQTMLLWEHHRRDASSDMRALLAGRATFAPGRNFKLVGELAHARLRPQGAQLQALTRATLAPTLSVGRGRDPRTELSLYAGHVHGSVAAGQALDGLPADSRYGAHVLLWF